MRFLMTVVAVALCCMAIPAHAQTQQVLVTIENLQPGDGFYLTPLWTAFHNGGFDYFDAGSMASGSLEALAEGGDVSGLQTDFAAFGSGQSGVITSPGGFAGAPVVDPGEIASMVFNVNTTDRFLSYGTMIIPSNDGFFGNDNGMGIEIFDAAGNFSFAGPLEFTMAQLWDAGTEVNNGLGAAFSATGGTDTSEALNIALHGGLNNFDGTGTADGTTINFANASGSPVFRLSVSAVPEPGSFVFLSAFGCVGLMRHRRSKD